KVSLLAWIAYRSELARSFSSAGCSGLPDTLADTRVGRSAGYGRHDADGVPVFSPGGLFVEEANVFIVQINVHKTANFAVVGIQMLAEFAEICGQAAQSFAHGIGRAIHAGLLACELAQRSWNHYLYGHTINSPSLKSSDAR